MKSALSDFPIITPPPSFDKGGAAAIDAAIQKDMDEATQRRVFEIPTGETEINGRHGPDTLLELLSRGVDFLERRNKYTQEMMGKLASVAHAISKLELLDYQREEFASTLRAFGKLPK